MKLKNLIGAAVACTAALTLASCGGGEKPNEGGNTGGGNTQTVEFGGANLGINEKYAPKTETLKVWGPANQQEVLTQLTAKWVEYMKTKINNFNVTVEVGIMGETDVRKQLQNSLEDSADVFAFANDNLVEFSNAGYVTALGGARVKYLQEMNDESAYNAGLAPNGKVYGYPVTGDNGYFLMYDASKFTENDVLRFDDMFKKADPTSNRIYLDLDNSWYDAGFFFGAGCSYSVTYNEKGEETKIECDFNDKIKGMIAGKAILGIKNQGDKLLNDDDSKLLAGVADGSCRAAITGTWNAPDIMKKWGTNFRATKLPSFTVDGKDYQMGSFNGVKLMGVNPKSKDQVLASSLASYLTCKESQVVRYEISKVSPSMAEARNEAKGFKDDVLAKALAEQNALSVSKVQSSVPQNYWTAVETFAQEICQGKVTLENMQAKLDQMAKLIQSLTKPEK